MADTMERWARKGLLTIAFDAPYHGERALPEAGLKLFRRDPCNSFGASEQLGSTHGTHVQTIKTNRWACFLTQ